MRSHLISDTNILKRQIRRPYQRSLQGVAQVPR